MNEVLSWVWLSFVQEFVTECLFELIRFCSHFHHRFCLIIHLFVQALIFIYKLSMRWDNPNTAWSVLQNIVSSKTSALSMRWDNLNTTWIQTQLNTKLPIIWQFYNKQSFVFCKITALQNMTLWKKRLLHYVLVDLT